ncbi:MAG: hypothetical protein A2078_09940 [Nitrospirae bacterium GWC2_57_9]|nr:MAG: hypothetical protein A2078_09940 [Nitrospirae bacterium GWC2_57_9]
MIGHFQARAQFPYFLLGPEIMVVGQDRALQALVEVPLDQVGGLYMAAGGVLFRMCVHFKNHSFKSGFTTKFAKVTKKFNAETVALTFVCFVSFVVKK